MSVPDGFGNIGIFPKPGHPAKQQAKVRLQQHQQRQQQQYLQHIQPQTPSYQPVHQPVAYDVSTTYDVPDAHGVSASDSTIQPAVHDY